MTPTREIYWNIPGYGWLYAFFAIALIVFGYGIYRRYRLWRLGGPENRFDYALTRLKALVVDGLFQRSILRERVPGLMHVAIFSGFVVLFIGTLLVFLQADFTLKILYGTFYLYYSLVLDIFGVIFILGILFAMFRRYVLRPECLQRVLDDALLLGLLLVIAVSGFFVEGLRIAATNPEWRAWSPVGNWIAGFFANSSLASLESAHENVWWGHLFVSLGFVAYIPFSKLFHIFVSPANIYFKSLGPKAELLPIDIETSETFGVSTISEFTWKQLFDLDACTHCGRCQDVCPAYVSGKPLSPKKIILDLRDHMSLQGKSVRKKGDGSAEGDGGNGKRMIGGAVLEDELWSCTTCLACQEHCPVGIEHVRKIVDMRRSLVLMEGKFPQELNPAFRGLETNANPWGMGSTSRADWAEGMDVKTIADNPEPEYVWFVGCAGSFDDRGVKISKALAKILNTAGVNYAILGTEEQCCGDPARRAGNEYVSQMLMQQNVETLKKYGVGKILTACPHGYNVFKNEYPRFGGQFEVVHHSQLIAELIRDGRLTLNTIDDGKVAFHDSCYLGRYNGVYQEPRAVLRTVIGHKPVELGRALSCSFCCGAGGARMWMEENLGSRINHLRTQEIIDSGAGVVGVACPFCLIMLDDGVKNMEGDESLQVLDIAQLVEKALPQ